MKFQTTLFIKNSNVKSSEDREDITSEQYAYIYEIRRLLNEYISLNEMIIEDAKILIDYHKGKEAVIVPVDVPEQYLKQITEFLSSRL